MSLEPTDANLVLTARTGGVDGTAAFQALVERYQERIFAFLYQLSSNRADAEDLTQETFLLALKKLTRFDSSQPFAPWLFTLARRTAISQWRKKRPTTPLLDHDEAISPTRSHHDAVVLWDLARAHLREVEFTALWLHYQEDLPVKDIARTLKKTTAHAKVLLSRARQKLKSTITAEEFSFESPKLSLP